MIDALYTCFDAGSDLDDFSLEDAIKATVPLSATMGDRLKELRQWARGRTRPASGSVRQESAGGRKGPDGSANGKGGVARKLAV